MLGTYVKVNFSHILRESMWTHQKGETTQGQFEQGPEEGFERSGEA